MLDSASRCWLNWRSTLKAIDNEHDSNIELRECSMLRRKLVPAFLLTLYLLAILVKFCKILQLWNGTRGEAPFHDVDLCHMTYMTADCCIFSRQVQSLQSIQPTVMPNRDGASLSKQHDGFVLLACVEACVVSWQLRADFLAILGLAAHQFVLGYSTYNIPLIYYCTAQCWFYGSL